jgi:hypothetical protein
MAIKRFNSYEKTQSYKDYEQLPKGGYILKIMGAEVCENSVGQYVKISCDVAEGEHKDFFAKEYKAQQSEDKKWHCNYLLNVPKDDGTEQDGWTARRFKTVIEAMEESNSGYHFDWDERKFKGKLIGGLFNEREYEKNDGTIGKATNLAQLCSVEKIRSGNYKIPADKALKSSNVAHPTSGDGFMNIPEGAGDELPFD